MIDKSGNEKKPRPILGITIGDPAGIGPEICLKALNGKEIYAKAIPIVYADRIVLEDALKTTGLNLTLRPIKEPKDALGDISSGIEYIEAGVITKQNSYRYGEAGATAGEAAFQCMLKAINDAMSGNIQAVVTCPICKEALNMAGHKFAGHTEILAHYTNTKNYGMLLSAKVGKSSLNVIHVTTHVPLRKACEMITRERVFKTICLAHKALTLMGSAKKRIAVAGLNPHSSENGLFGNEEAEAIIPAINDAREKGMDLTGPVPPDTVFVKALGGVYDIVVAMYHDQGHIPLKLCGFSLGNGSTRMCGVNASIGLPIIRTSVDHGTAFDIAGKNLANEESLVDALDMALTLAYHD